MEPVSSVPVALDWHLNDTGVTAATCNSVEPDLPGAQTWLEPGHTADKLRNYGDNARSQSVPNDPVNQSATADHVVATVQAENAKQTVDVKNSMFNKMLAIIGTIIGSSLFTFLGLYATTAQTNPTDDAQTLAVKVLQEQVTVLIGRLAVQPVVAAPVPDTVKLWQPDATGEPGKGNWVQGRVVGPWEKK